MDPNENTDVTPSASDTPWNAGLSEEFKDNPALADFADINGLAKSYLDTKSMVGGMLRVPGEDAGDEDRSAFRQKLLDKNIGLMATPDTTDDAAMQDLYRSIGMPEEANGYSPIEGMPDARFGQLTKLAHEAGISDKQFTKVLGSVLEADTAMATQYEADRVAGVDQLRGEWGMAFDEKSQRAARIAEATKAPPALVQAMKDGKVDAGTMRWLDSLAGSLGGEGTSLANDLGDVNEDTRSELMAKRDELTRKLQRESLPQAEHNRLVQKLVGYNEKLAS